MTESITWTIEKRKLKDLKPHPHNPRKLSKHDAEHLQRSLEKYGLIDKPILNVNDQIIGGHQRLAVLKKMGHKEIECWVPDRSLEDKEVNELNIRLNRNTGEWDFDVLANEFEINDLIEWGFTEEELSINLEDLGSQEEPDNEVLEPPKDPKTKLGDVYDLGDHRILCGDSCNPDAVNFLFDFLRPDRQLQMGSKRSVPILMVTDPPYGVNYDASWRKDIKQKHGVAARALGKVQNDDKVNWALAWHLFPGSVAYVWHASLFGAEVYKSLQESEFEIINQIIWVKQHFALSRGDYHWQHEPCYYAVKKGHKHNWQGARDQSTTWEISNLNAFGKNQDDERTAHSTQKPLDCMARPIRNNTAEGESVYDPFAGSFTTMMACEQLKRICYSIELDPGYVDIGVSRWVKYRKKNNLPYKVICNGEEIEWEISD